MEEVEVEGTTGDREEVLAMREQTGLLWVELAIGCLDITLEGVTMEAGVLGAASSVERGGTKPMTVQIKEEEVVVVEAVEKERKELKKVEVEDLSRIRLRLSPI